MPLDITVVYNADTDSPGVDFTITGLSGTGTVTVRRIDNTAEDATVVVRGWQATTQSGTTMTGSDFEAPINRSIKYRVEADSTQDDSGNITIPYASFGDAWLKSVAFPVKSRKINITEWKTTEYSPRILGKYNILGREHPVVLTDVFGSRTGALKFTAWYDGSTAVGGTWRDIYDLVVGGGTLLLQTADNDFTGESDMFFEVESYERTRLGTVRSDGLLQFEYTVQFIEVDRPNVAEASLGIREYQDVVAENASYQAVVNEYPSYLELVQRAPD